MKTLQVNLLETIKNVGYINVPDSFTLEQAIQYAYRHPEEVDSPRNEEEVVSVAVECDNARFIV